MKKNCTIVLLLLVNLAFSQIHPAGFATANEFSYVSKSIKTNDLLKQSYQNIKKEVDQYLDTDIDVPLPKDPAGGYTHDQHKFIYNLVFNAGLMYQLNHDKRYGLLVKRILLKYARINPGLKNHPQATSSSPGRLFWQALNDANWLLYTGMAFDLVNDYLTVDEKKTIADKTFAPIVEYFVKDRKDWFNLIHNHAVWASAGVGMVGIATDNQDYVQMALYGTEKDGKAGFLANLDGLFSPDGYYNEGPYYTRYALLPFYLFANAVDHVKPELKIFRYRDGILKKALDVALQQTNLTGEFFSYNDALKDKTYQTNEVVNAIDIAWQAYGADSSYLPICLTQKRVILNRGGADIANAVSKLKNRNTDFPYQSAEFTDGKDGKQGGVSVLRNGKGKALSSLIFKYSSHGLSHGHYDKLNINYYDKGNEILQDYGAVRYINIEQKWGGRYLPETVSYAQQTIAHNTITVDETSHYKGDEKTSEQHHPDRLFGDVRGGNVQVVSAMDEHAYEHVKLVRTVYMIRIPGSEKAIVADVFKTISDSIHQYDLPFNYLGTLISTDFKYNSNNNSMQTLGAESGYQHLWVEAAAEKVSPFSQFTFLNHSTFYTVSTLSSDSVQVFFTRTGANDPNFNLRRDPSVIVRAHDKQHTFINVLEPHGNFNPVTEIAKDSKPSVRVIEPAADNEEYTAFTIRMSEGDVFVIQCNKDFNKDHEHQFMTTNGISCNWKGPYYVSFNHQKIQ